jgi:hypothetical protein
MRVTRLCLVGNLGEKNEAEPLDMRYQAEPGNEGFLFVFSFLGSA